MRKPGGTAHLGTTVRVTKATEEPQGHLTKKQSIMLKAQRKIENKD